MIDAKLFIESVQRLFQIIIKVRVRVIAMEVMTLFQKRFDVGRGGLRKRRGTDGLTKRVVGHLGPRHAQHVKLLRHESGDHQMEKRRQQFAVGQIAGGAENHNGAILRDLLEQTQLFFGVNFGSEDAGIQGLQVFLVFKSGRADARLAFRRGEFSRSRAGMPFAVGVLQDDMSAEFVAQRRQNLEAKRVFLPGEKSLKQ